MLSEGAQEESHGENKGGVEGGAREEAEIGLRRQKRAEGRQTILCLDRYPASRVWHTQQNRCLLPTKYGVCTFIQVWWRIASNSAPRPFEHDSHSGRDRDTSPMTGPYKGPTAIGGTGTTLTVPLGFLGARLW